MAYSVLNLEVVGLSSLDKIKSGIGINKIGWDSAMPLAGSYHAGDIIYNTRTALGGATGWICIVDGSPGLWTTLPETVA